jgi:hypothetical protein
MAKSHNLASDFTKSLGVAKNVVTLAKNQSPIYLIRTYLQMAKCYRHESNVTTETTDIIGNSRPPPIALARNQKSEIYW